jgi:SsrA-binding protein
MISGKAMLVGATVTPYQPKNTPAGYDPQQNRLLLFTKKQLDTLAGLSKSHGLTLIPLKLYDKHGRIKLLVGIARGKKKYDKRESIRWISSGQPWLMSN